MKKKVIVTGANGYIAQHIIFQLLEKNYSVVGTVRSSSKGEKLVSLFGSKCLSYEVIEDLTNEERFEVVLKKHSDAVVFIHTASPVTFEAMNTERDVIIPIMKGMQNVLTSIAKYGRNIKHIVLTSTDMTIIKYDAPNKFPSGYVNEGTWNTISYDEALSDGFRAYSGGKTFAEKFAWDFQQKNGLDIPITTLHPTYVIGPHVFDESIDHSSLNFSSETIASLLRLKPGDDIPHFEGGFIDVRDVAKAHIVAFERSLQNQRVILNASNANSHDIIGTLRRSLSKLQATLPTEDSSICGELTGFILDDSQSRELLDYEYITLEKSLIDTATQLLA